MGSIEGAIQDAYFDAIKRADEFNDKKSDEIDFRECLDGAHKNLNSIMYSTFSGLEIDVDDLLDVINFCALAYAKASEYSRDQKYL
jgi:hypothetical protein